MISLTTEEKSEILNLSRNFVEIHQEIVGVEKEIKRLEELSSELIAKLEDCRERECDFTQSLSSKYGEGSLDAINLAWKKEELVNEVL
jgi:hypothetical protein